MKSLTKTIIIIALFVGSFPIPSVDGAGWLDGWDYQQGITITGSTGAGVNYPVYLNVTYDSNMQVDFDDLRFTDDDGSTLLDHWLEYKVDSSYAEVWVKVTDNLNDTQIIYLYYGNDAVSTTSDSDATFIFFDDFEDGTLNAWNHNGSWQIVSSQKAEGTYSAYCIGNAADRLLATDNYSIASGGVMVMQYVRFDSIVGMTGFPSVIKESNGDGLRYTNTQGGKWQFYDVAGGYQDYPNAVTHLANTWYRLTLGYDLDNDKHNGWANSSELGEISLLDTASASVADFDDFQVLSSYTPGKNMWVDQYIIRKWITDEPVAAWGLWSTINTPEVIFPVGWDPVAQFGYDMFFIVLGLIMIPASTMYLVRGGRSEISMDKVFMFLLLFIAGWGLFLGGITP